MRRNVLITRIKSLYHSLTVSDVPDLIADMLVKISLHRALDAPQIPTPGPPPDGISIHEAIQVCSILSISNPTPLISKQHLGYWRVYAIFNIKVQFFDMEAQNSIFDIDVQSSISKV
jgi:hypothetical protein